MKIVSNKRYDELVQAKKDIDILHQLFRRRKVCDCSDHISKEAYRLGIPLHSTTNAIYALMDKYYNEIDKL